MKITDISDSSSNDKSLFKDDDQLRKEGGGRKRPLMERLNIPIEHLDFDYVKKCSDAREVERILRILRSGEEGTYVDLERCVEQRLEKLNPRSRLLRVETPALRSNELGDAEKETLTKGLTEWLSSFSNPDSEIQEEKLGKCKIFDAEENAEGADAEIHKAFPLPIRGTSQHAAMKAKGSNETASKKSSQRIKSWEYDKWDKFDVDAELTKLDITDMQVEEWERREKPKVIEEQKRIEKLMKEDTVDMRQKQKLMKEDMVDMGQKQSSKIVSTNGSNLADTAPKMKRESVNVKSYIEEVDEDEEGTVVKTTNTKNSEKWGRKTKIVIDDLHMPII